MGTLESFLQSHFTPSYSRPQNPVYGDGFQPGGPRGGEQFIPSARSGLDPIRDVDFVPRTVNGLQSTFEFNQPLTNISLFNVVGAPAAGSGPPGPPGPQGPAGLPGQDGTGGAGIETVQADGIVTGDNDYINPGDNTADNTLVSNTEGTPSTAWVMSGSPIVDSATGEVRFPRSQIRIGVAIVEGNLKVGLSLEDAGEWVVGAEACP